MRTTFATPLPHVSASVSCGPSNSSYYIIIVIFPASVYSQTVRAAYMYTYRHVNVDDANPFDKARDTTPLICSPLRLGRLVSSSLSRNSRVSDVGTVYLIRLYASSKQ